MELHHAKRSMFQTALAPIVYKRTQRPPSDDAVPDRADPGQPAIERAAIPRAVAWTDDELTEAEHRLQAPAHRAILVALRSSDPTALISAVSLHDNKDTKVVSEVVSTLARVRSQNIRKGLDDITHHVDRLEKQLAERLSDDVVRVFEAGDDAEQSRLDRIAAAITRMSPGDANSFMREMADATTDDVDRRLDKVERAPASGQPQPLRRSGPGPSIEALRNHVRERILAQDFGSSRTLGQKVNRLILAAKSFDLDLTPVQMSAKKLGFTNGELLESAADVWKDWLDDLTQAADAAVPTQPFGYLHLERLDFVPAGVEHGELIYSIPLAPAEEVAIVHKEWSNTNEEFHKIVSDQFEDYSEKGVVEHTELGSSSQSQAQHASSFSLSMSASGGYGPISANVNTSYSTQQSDSQSRETSIRQTSETTKKASARSRKAHKISFRLAKKTGIEDQTVRKVENPDPIHPVRYDYYQLLRKWRVDLRRYGIRLTYRLTIPEPAIDLLGRTRKLRKLENKIEKGFAFDLEPEAVTRDNWVYLANFYGAKIDPPPRLMTAVQSFKRRPGPGRLGSIYSQQNHRGALLLRQRRWGQMVLRCVPATECPEVFQPEG